MSISSEITRITGLRDRIRTKLIALGLVSAGADLEDCTDGVEDITSVAHPNPTIELTEAFGIVTAEHTQAAGFVPGGTTSAEITLPVYTGSVIVTPSSAQQVLDTTKKWLTSNIVINAASGGLVYETGTYTPTANTARPTINFSKTYSVPPMLVMMVDATGTADTTTNAGMAFAYVDTYRLSSNGFPYSSSAWRYGFAAYAYRGTNASQLSAGATMFSYNSDNAGSSSSSYARYYATTSGFIPYTGSTSRYWIANRTYKWIAIWAA